MSSVWFKHGLKDYIEHLMDVALNLSTYFLELVEALSISFSESYLSCYIKTLLIIVKILKNL